jgi:hypothetical protein
VLDRAFQHPLELEENATVPFAGGIMQHGYQCGMIWGATLAAGAEAFRRHGPGPKAEAAAINAAQRVVDSFRTRHDEINCLEITDIDKSSSTWQQINYFLIKGGSIGCLRMAGWFAPLAFDEINSALSEEVTEGPSPPVSCAAMLARKMGESDMHAVMASGFAGGIGLCGGACGALGSAIWILGMKIGKEENGKIGFKDPRTQEVIDRFMKHTEFKFECSEIVGRKFKNVDDHADYLRDGGCSELIGLLAVE